MEKRLLLLFPERSHLGWPPCRTPARGGAGLPRHPEATAEGSAPRHPACVFSKSDFEGPLTTRSFSVVAREELTSSVALGSHGVWGYTGWKFFCSRSLENRVGYLRLGFRRFRISPCCRDAHHQVFPFVGWTGEKLDLPLLSPTRAAAFAPVEVLLWAKPGLDTGFFFLFFCLRFLRVC